MSYIKIVLLLSLLSFHSAFPSSPPRPPTATALASNTNDPNAEVEIARTSTPKHQQQQMQTQPALQKIRFTGGGREGEEYWSLGMDKNETKLLLFAAREIGGSSVSLLLSEHPTANPEEVMVKLIKSYKARLTSVPPPPTGLEFPNTPELERAMSGEGITSSLPEAVSELRSWAEWFKETLPYYHSSCFKCGVKETAFVGSTYPGVLVENLGLREEAAVGGGVKKDKRTRDEVYYCPSCRSFNTFVRSDDLELVCRTRKGRCGEYGLLAYSALREIRGGRVRWVVDTGDHVWVEVRLGGRWVMVDVCEGVVDEPMMYRGWGKRPSVVMAFEEREGKVEVEDVTLCYTDEGREEVRKGREVDLEICIKIDIPSQSDWRFWAALLLAGAVGTAFVGAVGGGGGMYDTSEIMTFGQQYSEVNL
ncbi:hypothetical protein TrCOL_g662 [Triparma columacea]|uniref:Transglutaminase-like domain-containing protein n=1 Tax=Triparma columacea TaxID=722753 RepID=A0A9W7LCC2_9STRA|nr:hypothetical protein TrCOL_g662 [Triparma columacea]